MSSTQEEFSDDVGFEVTDEVTAEDVGDLTNVKPDDTIPAARDVVFIVHEAAVDTRLDERKDGGDGALLGKTLRVQAKVADTGIDGEGQYAGRIIFCNLPLVLKLDAMRVKHDRQVAAGSRPSKPFNEQWHKDSMYGFREFALATGLAQMVEDEATGQKKWKMTGPINDEMLGILASGDVSFIANVSRTENKGMDRFENKLSKFRPVAQGEAE